MDDYRWEQKQQRWAAKQREREVRWQARQARRQFGDHTNWGVPGVIVAVLIVAVGVGLLLDNLGVLDFERIWDFWPLLLIGFGVSRAASAWGWGGRIWGGMLVLVGAIFLLNNLGWIHANLWNLFWPVMIIVWGVGMLLKNLDRQNLLSGSAGTSGSAGSGLPPGHTSNTVSQSVIFSGSKVRVESQAFEGGEAFACFGGIEIDLRAAAMQKEQVVIDANAFFGGIEIRVPETWAVSMRGTGIFGGFGDETPIMRPVQDVKRPLLIITGVALFGGVNVKN